MTQDGRGVAGLLGVMGQAGGIGTGRRSFQRFQRTTAEAPPAGRRKRVQDGGAGKVVTERQPTVDDEEHPGLDALVDSGTRAADQFIQ